jgi:hypothetical protein
MVGQLDVDLLFVNEPFKQLIHGLVCGIVDDSVSHLYDLFVEVTWFMGRSSSTLSYCRCLITSV